MTRPRLALLLILAFGLTVGSCAVLSHWAPKPLSLEARTLVAKAFEGLDPALPLVDHHTHLIGNGKGAGGIEVNPVMRSWLHPKKRLMTSAYLGAAGVP